LFCKIHGSKGTQVLACADSKVIGKTFKKGEIEFTVSESFYKGEKVSSKKLAALLEEFDNINLVGSECIKIALKQGLISQENIMKIGSTVHVQIFKI
jgi:hypothetical protein